MVLNHSYKIWRLLETEGTKWVEEEKNDSSTQVERGSREKKYKKHQLYFSVCWTSEASSPFIGRVHNKFGATYGLIKLTYGLKLNL